MPLSADKKSNAEWVQALQEDGSSIQHETFLALSHFLYPHIYYNIRQRAARLPALAALAEPELAAQAQDIVQEALLRIYHHLDQYTGKGPFLNFALVVARHLLIDEFRHRRWQTPQLPDEAGDPSDDGLRQFSVTLAQLSDVRQKPAEANAILQEMIQIVQEAIEQDLTANQAYAFIAFHFYDLSSKEIGERLGKTANAVDGLRFQACDKIRRRLLKNGYKIDDLPTL